MTKPGRRERSLLNLFHGPDPITNSPSQYFWKWCFQAFVIGPIVVGLGLFLLTCLAAYLIVPTDLVGLTIGPLPADIDAFMVVAEGEQGIMPILHYELSMLSYINSDPYFHTIDQSSANQPSGPYDPQPNGSLQDDVKWVSAQRYGVLMRRRDGQWRIWWAGPSDIRHPSAWRYLFRNGTAEMRLPATDQTVTSPLELLARLRPPKPDRRPPDGQGAEPPAADVAR